MTVPDAHESAEISSDECQNRRACCSSGRSRGAVQGEPGGPDATVVDADHYTTEFENEAVRIIRIEYGAGKESVTHDHLNSVAVFLTDITCG